MCRELHGLWAIKKLFLWIIINKTNERKIQIIHYLIMYTGFLMEAYRWTILRLKPDGEHEIGRKSWNRIKIILWYDQSVQHFFRRWKHAKKCGAQLWTFNSTTKQWRAKQVYNMYIFSKFLALLNLFVAKHLRK